MRDKVIVSGTALMIIFLLSVGLPAVVAEPASGYSVKVARVAQIGGWGLVTVNDTFTVSNNSPASLADLPVGLPRNLTAGLRYLAAKDDQNRVLTVERDLDPSSETFWFKVNFARTLSNGETYKFTVTSVFTNLFFLGLGGFRFQFVTSPILRVSATSENMTIIGGPQSKFSYPDWLKLAETTVGGYVQLNGFYGQIEAYTTRSFVLNMTSTAQFIVRVPSVSREISFGNEGTISVSDTYTFDNLAGSISTIQITLPANSSTAMAYDEIGALWDNAEAGPSVSVRPRYSGGIGTNRSFTFTLKYTLDAEAYVKEVNWWGRDSFKFSLLSNVRYWVVEKLETTVITPSGFDVRSISPSPSVTSRSIFYHNFEYNLTDVTPYTDVGLDLEYTYVLFWSGSLWLAWLGMVELVAVALVVVSRTRRPAALKIPVPTEKLKQFVELYDGRTALRLELDRMAEDLARGALNKHEYRRRRRAIELRMGELDRALQPFKQDLRTSSPMYGEMIFRMEKAEAEIDANWLSEEHFRSQYRSGRISKEAYEGALADLSKRIDKARGVIETGLVTLREEAR